MDDICKRCGHYTKPVIGTFSICERCDKCKCGPDYICNYCLDKCIGEWEGVILDPLEGQITERITPILPYKVDRKGRRI